MERWWMPSSTSISVCSLCASLFHWHFHLIAPNHVLWLRWLFSELSQLYLSSAWYFIYVPRVFTQSTWSEIRQHLYGWVRVSIISLGSSAQVLSCWLYTLFHFSWGRLISSRISRVTPLACFHTYCWFQCSQTYSVFIPCPTCMTSPGAIVQLRPLVLKHSVQMEIYRERHKSTTKRTGRTFFSFGSALMEPISFSSLSLASPVTKMRSITEILPFLMDSLCT